MGDWSKAADAFIRRQYEHLFEPQAFHSGTTNTSPNVTMAEIQKQSKACCSCRGFQRLPGQLLQGGAASEAEGLREALSSAGLADLLRHDGTPSLEDGWLSADTLN